MVTGDAAGAAGRIAQRRNITLLLSFSHQRGGYVWL